MKTKLFRIITLLILCFLLTNCRYRTPQFELIPKIDAHVHIRTTDFSFTEQAISDNFQLLTITTGSKNQESIDGQNRFAQFQNEKYPEGVYYATTFSMEGFGTQEWQLETINQLKRDFQASAIAVKVWKDIGMTFRDTDSSFIMIDDPRFDPILEFIASEGKSLIAHLGEPRNCWLPLDSMTVNSDREYFKNHPEYHMYLHPDFPSYEDQISARDNMLDKHPTLKVIGAHLGSLEWDVGKLAACLDDHPNFSVDLAARICHFQVQDREKVRDFITNYQDRILYGTDHGIHDNSDKSAAIEWLHHVWMEHWKYFSTDEELTSEKVNNSFKGLKLDKKILTKIYYKNAKNWIPGLAI